MNIVDKHSTLISSLLWLARISSVLSVVLLLLFFLGEQFNPSHISWREWVGLLFFPVGVVAGMVIAWRWEAVGGLTATLSLAGFYLIYGLILSGRITQGWAFCVFAAPGLLFLIHWLLSHGQAKAIAG